MKDDLIKLQKMFRDIYDGINSFRKNHREEFYKLCNRYTSATNDYVQRGLGDIISISSDYVIVEHHGWEGIYTKEFPVKLFTDPNFIVELEEAKELKTNKSKLADEERSRQEYLKLKNRFKE